MRKLFWIFLLAAGAVQAQDGIQRESVAERERAQFVTSTPARKWNGGIVRWFYNPAGQPLGLSSTVVVDAINRAADKWNGMCHVLFIYSGTTSSAPYMGNSSTSVDRQNVIGWGSSSYLIEPSYWYSLADGNFLDVDVLLGNNKNWSLDTIDSEASVILGYMLGLKNSNVNASVMANDTSRSYSFDKTLRGDDADGCASLYGAASTADSNRAFNWAESVYPQVLKPSPAASGTYNGYYYRYYSGSNSYVGTKDGTVFFMGPDGIIQNLGSLDTYKAQVRAAGF